MADNTNFENLAALADVTADSEELKPFFSIIETIMSIPEEELNPTVIESIQGMINGALTPAIRKQAVEELITTYKNNGASRGQVKNEIAGVKNAINDLLVELKPSLTKSTLLNGIFDTIYSIFDEVARRYFSYDIELPIKLDEGAQAPAYAHETDAAADIYALETMVLPAHSLSNKVRTGVRIALPEGWAMKLEPRSSIGAKTGLRLSNMMGIIDEEYRGEICILYDNLSDSDYEIKAGDRIAQCWVEPTYHFKPVIVDELSDTSRGEGGFGSTGQ